MTTAALQPAQIPSQAVLDLLGALRAALDVPPGDSRIQARCELARGVLTSVRSNSMDEISVRSAAAFLREETDG